MLALTLKQPWATLIFAGKDIENRSWPTSVRGQVAITASGKMDISEIYSACEFMQSWIPKFSTRIFSKEAYAYDTGVVLGTVEIIDCVERSDSPWFQGRFGFVLRNPRKLKVPIPVKGKQAFWTLPEDIERKVVEEMRLKL